jgi:hypothetical protein
MKIWEKNKESLKMLAEVLKQEKNRNSLKVKNALVESNILRSSS